MFSRVVPRNGLTTPSTTTSAATSRTFGKSPAPAAESAAAAFQEVLRQTLSRALRGGAHAAGGCSRALGTGRCDAVAGGGDKERVGLNAVTLGSGPRGDIGHGDHYHPHGQSQQLLPLLRSRSGSGLRQLASSFTPLVLDNGAVVSLGFPLPLTPSCAPSHGNTGSCKCNGNSCATGLASPLEISAADTLTGDFVVGFSSEKPAGIPGFPLPVQAEAPEEGHTETIAYAVLACQDDVDHAVAGARIGANVFAPDLCGRVAREEREGGLSGGVLGGVEEQVS